MHPNEIDLLLESKFLTYADLSTVSVCDNQESMVLLGEDDGIDVCPIDEGMTAYTGDGIWVRQSVALRLKEAQAILQGFMPTARLQVVYGYRHLDVQKKGFEKIKKELLAQYTFADEEALKEKAHISIAVPEVSGHPTGGAVDLHILKDGVPLDMGAELHEFTSKSYAFSPLISKEAWHNRQLLRICMTGAGFAPFDGEWWHFSYGDKEWAKFYNKPHALYEQLAFCSPSHTK